jgi:hypothetical protein
MTQNTIKPNAPKSIPSTERIEQPEPIKAEAAQAIETKVEQAEKADQAFTPAEAINAVMSTVTSDSNTAYSIMVLANLIFEILEIEKDGQIYQITPQKVYNKTKSLRASKGEHARFTKDEVAKIVGDLVSSGGGVRAGERIDRASVKAQAMKALKA